jgi:hypothetical protein
VEVPGVLLPSETQDPAFINLENKLIQMKQDKKQNPINAPSLLVCSGWLSFSLIYQIYSYQLIG